MSWSNAEARPSALIPSGPYSRCVANTMASRLTLHWCCAAPLWVGSLAVMFLAELRKNAPRAMSFDALPPSVATMLDNFEASRHSGTPRPWAATLQ